MEKSIYSPAQKQLLNWLKSKREESGLTMRAFAAELDKPHSFVGKVEQGERRLDVVEFVRYCKAMNIDPHEGITLILNLIE